MNKKVVVGFLVSVALIITGSIYFIFFHNTENIVEAMEPTKEEQIKEIDTKGYREFSLLRNDKFEKGNADEEVTHNSEYVYGNNNYHITYTTWNKENKRVMYIEDKKDNRTYATKRLDWTVNFPKSGLINWVFEYKDKLYGLNLLGNVIEVELDGASVNIFGHAMMRTKIKGANFIGIDGEFLYLRQGDKLYSYNLEERKSKLVLKSKNYSVTDAFYNGNLIIKNNEDNKYYLAKTRGNELEIVKEIVANEKSKIYFNENSLVTIDYKGEAIYKYSL